MRKRIVSLCVAASLFFAGIGGRIGYIVFSRNYNVSDSYNSYKLTVDISEPQFYFNDGTKINNNVTEYVAVIRPTNDDLRNIQKYYSSDELSTITKSLKEGYPIVRLIDKPVADIKTLEVNKTHSTLTQLISSQSNGLANYAQMPKRELSVNFHIDAMGRFLAGDRGRVSSVDYNSQEGLVLTIDSKIQNVAVQAAQSIKSGCVIVMDAKNAKILAVVNKPDSTYVNKAFEKYAVGSVFKIVVAAAALENNIDFRFTCTGDTRVGDTTFSCQNNRNHGAENLEAALANSCNCYFVNLALELGKDKIINTAKKLGFGTALNLYNSWNLQTSHLPSDSDLDSKGELSLLGFGQGKLLASPLQICSTLCTVANDGTYIRPSLVYAKRERNGSITEIKNNNSVHAVSKDTSKELRAYLRTVVTDGTGANAETLRHLSSGKTATAQTGQFIENREIYNTWFAGLYPYNEPKYAIVVMCEDGTSGAADCCPVFRTIVENIDK